jgi:hypothetical protein
MRKLRERRKAETSGVASELGVASTSRAAQAMDIYTDSEQSTRSQTESTQYSRRSFCNSHNATCVIHSFCCLCNKCILIHKNFIFFTSLQHLDVFTQKRASLVSLKYHPPHFLSDDKDKVLFPEHHLKQTFGRWKKPRKLIILLTYHHHELSELVEIGFRTFYTYIHTFYIETNGIYKQNSNVACLLCWCDTLKEEWDIRIVQNEFASVNIWK